MNRCICEMEADTVCLFASQVWCTAPFVIWGWKDLQDTSVSPKLKLLVWMKVMKTDAFLELKLWKHCFFSSTLNHNAGFQKDVLKLGFCQASSKVSYLTRRGYGIDLSTRCTVQEKLNRIPSPEAQKLSVYRTNAIGLLHPQEGTLVSLTWQQWQQWVRRNHCFCPEEVSVTSTLTPSWNRVAFSFPSKPSLLHCSHEFSQYCCIRRKSSS